MLPETGQPKDFKKWFLDHVWQWRCPMCGMHALPAHEVVLHQCFVSGWEADDNGCLYPTYNTFRVSFDERGRHVHKQIESGHPPP